MYILSFSYPSLQTGPYSFNNISPIKKFLDFNSGFFQILQTEKISFLNDYLNLFFKFLNMNQMVQQKPEKLFFSLKNN